MNTASENFPLISIVTPSFNQGEFLEECIDSVLSQNYPNLEYIVMDGGSSDDSVEIIKKYEKHLSYWQSQPDGGQYNAVSDGFKKTSGEIMAWLNSDDKYHRDAFYKTAYLFESYPEVEWLTGRPTFWSKEGCLARFEATVPAFSRQDFLEGRFHQPFIQQESTFWRRSLWERAGGGVCADLEYAGDLDLWLRFFRHALLYSVNSFLAGYRSHGDQKAVLHMDRYLAEAEQIITAERQIYALPMHPAAPTPLAIDLCAYRDYLTCLKSDKSNHSPELMASAESSLQHLLQTADTLLQDRTKLIKDLEFLAQEVQQQQEKRLQFETAAQNLNAGLQAVNASLKLLESSLSWRITKPLRWLGDRIRPKA